MLAFAQDEKPKPANKLSEMAEKHRKEMKSKAKQALKPRRVEQEESNSDTEGNTEKNQNSAKNKQELNTAARAKRKGGWGTVKKELISKEKDEKTSEESDTVQDKKVGWNFVKKEVMSKITDERSAEELDITHAKKTGGWTAIKREMIAKKDEKRKPYRGWYANRARKASDEDTKSLKSGSNSVDNDKQTRPSSEKVDKSIPNNKESKERKEAKESTGSETRGKDSTSRNSQQETPRNSTPRGLNNESTKDKTDQVSDNSASESSNVKDKISNEGSDSAIDDEKESNNEADETNDSLNERTPVTDDSDFDSEEEPVIEIPEPETLSPSTYNRLRAKRNTFVIKRTGKVAFSTPAGMLATPRVKRT